MSRWNIVLLMVLVAECARILSAVAQNTRKPSAQKGSADLEKCRATEGDPNHSKVPGVVINHSPASSRQYIGSPGLATLPGGEYVVSHDFFGPGSTHDRTLVFASRNQIGSASGRE